MFGALQVGAMLSNSSITCEAHGKLHLSLSVYSDCLLQMHNHPFDVGDHVTFVYDNIVSQLIIISFKVGKLYTDGIGIWFPGTWSI